MAQVSATKASRLARNFAYPQQIWWLIASFLALLTLLHLTNVLIIRQQRKALLASRKAASNAAQIDAEKARNVSSSNLKTSFLTRLVTAVRETVFILLYRYTIPVNVLGNVAAHRANWAEISIVTAYTIMVLVWTFINCYNSDTGLKLDPLFYANRAGDIATSHIPLLVLLAGKNNIISLITGISFEKLHVLHRAIARVALILILIHTGGRLQLGLTSDESSAAWLQLGYVALAVWIVSIIILIRPLRARFYNILTIAHLFLSLTVIITTYIHAYKANVAQNFARYLIPAIFLWGLDRVLRIIRIVCNSRGSSSGFNKAEIMSSDLIKLTVQQKMSWKAGQSAYITISKISIMPFEAHPFTIVTLPMSEKNVLNDLVFLIKVRDGFTKRLYRAIGEAQSRNEEFQFSAFIDGPYGTSPDLCSFSDVVIIVGGSGLSFGLPVLRQIIRSVEDGRSACTSALLVWVTATPDINTLTWILDSFKEILQSVPAPLQVKIQLYSTAAQAASDCLPSLNGTPKDDKDGKDIEEETKPKTPEEEKTSTLMENISDAMAILPGRPNFKHLLEEKLSLVQNNLSVNVAGPPSMIEDVRRNLRFNIITPEAKLKGQPAIHLYTKPHEIA